MDKRVREISRFLLRRDASSPPPSGASLGLFYPEIPPHQYSTHHIASWGLYLYPIFIIFESVIRRERRNKNISRNVTSFKGQQREIAQCPSLRCSFVRLIDVQSALRSVPPLTYSPCPSLERDFVSFRLRKVLTSLYRI